MAISSRARQLWDDARRLPRGGVVAVTAGFLLHLSLGSMYTFGNLTTYMTSYLHVRLGLDVDYGNTNWVGTIQSVTEGPGVLLGSICFRRFGPRPTILVGSVLCTGGMALTCLGVQTSLAVTMLTYGMMGGFGIGLAYTSPMLTGYEWFPRNRGVVSGIVVGGYGLGSIILTSVQTSYLNPDNVSPEDDGFFHDDALLDRVPSLFLLQAGICAVLQVCGVLGIHLPPKERGELLSEETDVKSPATTAEDDNKRLPDKPPMEGGAEEDPKAWRKYVFTVHTLQLMLAYAMNAYGMVVVNSFWKAFGQTFIKDDHFLAMVGMVSSVFNMLGRMLWGYTCDKLGYKTTMMLITGLVGSLVFTFPATSLVGKGMFLVWMWAIFLSVSGTFSVVVTGTAATFGSQHAGHIYGVIFFVAAMGSLLVSLASEAILDRWDFPEVFLMGGGLVCISLVATLTFRPRSIAVDHPPTDAADTEAS